MPSPAGRLDVEQSALDGQAGIAHAMADLAVIAECYPTPPADPWNERLVHENLACIEAEQAERRLRANPRLETGSLRVEGEPVVACWLARAALCRPRIPQVASVLGRWGES